jgi:uncharacterized protein
MFIDLASVGTTPKPLKAEFKPDEIDLDFESRLASAAVFRGEIYGDQGRAHVEGMITAKVETACTRCLEPVTRPFEIAFSDIFVDASRENLAREAEIGVADMDESLVIGGRVDVAEVVREQILLAMPEQVLCTEDCRGLCPKCGGNLNLIDCSCDSDETDPRWSALKNLKSQ